MPQQQQKTVAEILPADPALNPQVRDIFVDVDPALATRDAELRSLLTTERATELLERMTNLGKLLSIDDNYEITLSKLQGQIDEAEKTRDGALAEIFEKVRPIERSYEQVRLFFENAKGDPTKAKNPIELYLLNADPASIKDSYSITIAALESHINQKNDNFDFKDDICNLVVPGSLPQDVREKLEEIANNFGVLLIGDIRDERSFKDVEDQFREGGAYAFLVRPDEKASSDVVTVGYLKVRDKHWFEREVDKGDDLYVPGSIAFAGSFVRADSEGGISQGPVGMKFGVVKGPMKARFEPLIAEMTQLSMKRQLIPVVRDANNRLCFYGCRSLADDPKGVLKFFTSYRILRYIERRVKLKLLEVAGQKLTREFMEQEVDEPLRNLMQDEVKKGSLLSFDLFVDKSEDKRMMGICDITLSVKPTGLLETVNLEIEVPPFEPAGEK
jgi:hypothetical protein